jgi:hypothetical protein
MQPPTSQRRTTHLMRYPSPRPEPLNNMEVMMTLQLCSCPSNIQFSKIYDRFSAIGTSHSAKMDPADV